MIIRAAITDNTEQIIVTIIVWSESVWNGNQTTVGNDLYACRIGLIVAPVIGMRRD